MKKLLFASLMTMTAINMLPAAVAANTTPINIHNVFAPSQQAAQPNTMNSSQHVQNARHVLMQWMASNPTRPRVSIIDVGCQVVEFGRNTVIETCKLARTIGHYAYDNPGQVAMATLLIYSYNRHGSFEKSLGGFMVDDAQALALAAGDAITSALT